MSKSGMPLTPSSQYITLISNASLNAFPDNSPSNFTTRFDPPLELHGQGFEVALVDILYPNSWKNIPEGENEQSYSFRLSAKKLVRSGGRSRLGTGFVRSSSSSSSSSPPSLDNHDKENDISHDSGRNDFTEKDFLEPRLVTVDEQTVTLPDRHYDALDQILFVLNARVRKSLLNLSTKSSNSSSYSPSSSLPYKEFHFPNKQSRVDIFTFKKIQGKVLIHLSDYITLTLTRQLADLLGFKETVHRGPTLDLADFEVSLNLDLGSLFVYLNIVQDRVVGDVRAPLIGLLPVSKKHTGLKLASRYFYTPQYFPLKSNFIDSVTCNIRDENGRLIPFKDGQTTLTLHLRRRLLS